MEARQGSSERPWEESGSPLTVCYCQGTQWGPLKSGLRGLSLLEFSQASHKEGPELWLLDISQGLKPPQQEDRAAQASGHLTTPMASPSFSAGLGPPTF